LEARISIPQDDAFAVSFIQRQGRRNPKLLVRGTVGGTVGGMVRGMVGGGVGGTVKGMVGDSHFHSFRGRAGGTVGAGGAIGPSTYGLRNIRETVRRKV
jgi:hypothetical protein